MKTQRFSKIAAIALAMLLLVGAVVGITVAAEDTGATSLKIAGKNLAYEGALQVVYYVDAPDYNAESQTLKMNFWVGTIGNTPSYTKEFDENNVMTVGGKTYYCFFSNGIAPVDMTKPIYAQAFVENADGTTITEGEIAEYSVYTYAMNRFSQSPTEDQLTLYKALLDYGAAVQDVLGDPADVEKYGWADAYYDITKTVFVDDVPNLAESLIPGRALRPSELELDEKGHVIVLANSTVNGAIFKNVTGEDGYPIYDQYALPGTRVYNINYTTEGFMQDFEGQTDVNKLFVVDRNGGQSADMYYNSMIESVNAREDGKSFMLYETGDGNNTNYLVTGSYAKQAGWKIDLNDGSNMAPAVGVKYIVDFDFQIVNADSSKTTYERLAYFGVNSTYGPWWVSTDGGNTKNFVSADLFITGDDVVYMDNNTNLGIDSGKWYDVRYEYEIVGENLANIRIYINGVLLATKTTTTIAKPETFFFEMRNIATSQEYYFDNLYITSFGYEKMKGTGSMYNEKDTVTDVKYSFDDANLASIVKYSSGVSVGNKNADNALIIANGELVAKTSADAGAGYWALVGADNSKNVGEVGTKYVAEFDFKVGNGVLADGKSALATLALVYGADGANKVASFDIVPDGTGCVSLGDASLAQNIWYNVRVEYEIFSNGFKVNGVANTYYGILSLYVNDALVSSKTYTASNGNAAFDALYFATDATNASFYFDNLYIDVVAAAGAKGAGKYYNQQLVADKTEVSTAEKLYEFDGTTLNSTIITDTGGGTIVTNQDQAQDVTGYNRYSARHAVVTGTGSFKFGSDLDWGYFTMDLGSVPLGVGETVVLEFDYLFMGSTVYSNTPALFNLEINSATGKITNIAPVTVKGTQTSFNGTYLNADTWYNIRIEFNRTAEANIVVSYYLDNAETAFYTTTVAAAHSEIKNWKFTVNSSNYATYHDHLIDNIVVDNTSKSVVTSYFGQYNAGTLTNAVAYDADATTNVYEIFNNPGYKFVNVNKRPAEGSTGNYVLVEDGAVVVGTGSGFNYPSYLKFNLDFADIAVGSKIVAEYDYQFVSSTDYLNTGSAIITNVGFTKTNSQDDTNFNSLDMWAHYYVGSSWVNPDDNGGGSGVVTMTPGTWYKLRVEIDVTETGIVKTYFVNDVQKYQETFNGVTVASIGGFVMKFTRNVDVQEHKYDNFVFAVIPPVAE